MDSIIKTHKGVIRFNGEIDDKTSQQLMSDIEEKLKDYQGVIIYFTSEGGYATEANVIVDYMNLNADRITLVGTWCIWSAGFHIFWKFNGYRKLVSPVHGMTHLLSNTFDSLTMMNRKSYDHFNFECLKKDNEKYSDELKCLLSEDEYKRVAAGEDVYFNEARLREIFKIEDGHK